MSLLWFLISELLSVEKRWTRRLTSRLIRTQKRNDLLVFLREGRILRKSTGRLIFWTKGRKKRRKRGHERKRSLGLEKRRKRKRKNQLLLILKSERSGLFQGLRNIWLRPRRRNSPESPARMPKKKTLKLKLPLMQVPSVEKNHKVFRNNWGPHPSLLAPRFSFHFCSWLSLAPICFSWDQLKIILK